MATLRLKALLERHQLRQIDLGNAIIQVTGLPMSDSSVSLIANRNRWPRRTERADIKRQAEQWLRGQGVPEAEIRTAWQIDPDAPPPLTARVCSWLDSGEPQPPKGGHKTKIPAPAPEEEHLPEAAMLTETARKHFRLFGDPLRAELVSTDDVYLGAEQRYILEAMRQAVRSGDWIAVIGEPGAGKSVLRASLYERLRRDGEPVRIVQPQTVDRTRLTASQILDALVWDFDPAARPKGALEAKARQVKQLLARAREAGERVALFLEESQDLTVPTIKYLKRLRELHDGLGSALAVVMVGQPELGRLLDERQSFEAREAIQRITPYTLPALTPDEVEEYLAARLRPLSRSYDELFARGVGAAVVQRLTIPRGSMAYPLRVNHTITRALNAAAQAGEARVTAELIRGV